MESESLANIHLLTNIEKEVAGEKVSGDVFISYFFSFHEIENTDKIFQRIFSTKSERPFSLTIPINDSVKLSLSATTLDKFFLILCHPFYIKSGKFYVVGYVPTQSGESSSEVIKWLTLKSKEQGLNLLLIDISQENLEEKNQFQRTLLPLSISPDNFHDWYLGKIIGSLTMFNIFVDAEKQDVQNLIYLKRLSEKKLQSENPTLFRLIQHIQNQKIRIENYEQLTETLLEELSSKKDYLDFILGKFKSGENVDQVDFNQIMKIKQFYHNEYEILPSWYKRTGHIIKVIMGKRTFRSLFDDNAKKYK